MEGKESSNVLDRAKKINRTYIISAPARQSGDGPNPGRFFLQKRKPNSKGQDTVFENANQSVIHEKRLVLQRRNRTGSIDKDNAVLSEKQVCTSSKVLLEQNSTVLTGSVLLRSSGLTTRDYENTTKDIIKSVNAPGKTPEKSVLKEESTVSTPTGKTKFNNISVKKEVFESLWQKDGSKSFKQSEVEKFKQISAENVTPATLNKGVSLISRSQKIFIPWSGPIRKTTAQLSAHSGDLNTKTRPPSGESLISGKSGSLRLSSDSLKMENSAVTVAVRVRPFSSREKNENANQVIFIKNHETVVEHPDTKQTHTFYYDFSFYSVDEMDQKFASQQAIYEKLARPLLKRAFEGFNICLFAYGQTGSGKSYTMMGCGEEAGVIPRFCEELLLRVSSYENKEVTCHLEMSYFEVYNEKIHDLLVSKDELNQKKMPLRVREHPVHGPYIADLAMTMVSSYSDIQAWLELGNKQRATAATAMNDKSSRSHSVFTLVVTQTKTELVEGERHDHRIISRINLVDLAGSERCTTAQTNGDRMREGANINKSLLTLGKVISLLSEQAQSRKKVFIPYRESVLTWLLKESLGGNSKTAMIATLSPASSSVDESLSTLRYAQQARLIINVAKVNEDTNAKLIRELKAEVEKLRAAQLSPQVIDPEKMRQFQQEIMALKTQLSQQEREMAEVHRTWKEKLEQAEEKKELQRVGVTFKVDNRLPNLVNLNEDPQLSEMLLYMIKEGKTKVGKLKSKPTHDIQLSGALIADEHCVISNVNDIVIITPMENAKTFVNGNLVCEATILHHGDRVILGGDHYFRFNHPAEVQCGKRVSCWINGDGQKDFEFAKNELLSTQRARLEAEIEEARLKAKVEMMQEIQVAKDMAQKELFDQKLQYENRIKALERELVEENERKRVQELERQQVVSEMEQLQTAKSLLEKEMSMHKRRLHIETQAARQAMAENDIRHAKILEALEAEKKKIAEDIVEIQRKRALKASQSPKTMPRQWDAMKLSLMIEEANKISVKFRKHIVFSRHEVSEKGNRDDDDDDAAEMNIQVQNIKLGIFTFWSLEKFESNLAVMRELELGKQTSENYDVFYDPNDQWKPDISTAFSSSFSCRRSRSFLKSRRISGRMYNLEVHPIQSLNCTSTQPSGLMSINKPISLYSSNTGSPMFCICKNLIADTVGRLHDSTSAMETESLATKLTLDLLSIHNAANSIAVSYEQLDDNSPENLFACSTAVQTHLVRATSEIERAVFITLNWTSNMNSSTQSVSQTVDKLKVEVKNVGGFFQLLIQGCESEISSMVTEALKKMSRCIDAALSAIGLLAVVTGTHLHLSELGSDIIGKKSAVMSMQEGMCKGVRVLLEEGFSISREMLRYASLAQPSTLILQSFKSKALDVANALQIYFKRKILEKPVGLQNGSGDVDASELELVKNMTTKHFQLNQTLQELHSYLSITLRGGNSNIGLWFFKEEIKSLSKKVGDLVHGLLRHADVSPTDTFQLPCSKNVMGAGDNLHSALCSLAALFEESYEENKE